MTRGKAGEGHDTLQEWQWVEFQIGRQEGAPREAGYPRGAEPWAGCSVWVASYLPATHLPRRAQAQQAQPTAGGRGRREEESGMHHTTWGVRLRVPCQTPGAVESQPPGSPGPADALSTTNSMGKNKKPAKLPSEEISDFLLYNPWKSLLCKSYRYKVGDAFLPREHPYNQHPDQEKGYY